MTFPGPKSYPVQLKMGLTEIRPRTVLRLAIVDGPHVAVLDVAVWKLRYDNFSDQSLTHLNVDGDVIPRLNESG